MAIEDFVIEQEAGENLQQVISGVLVKSPIEVVKELVSNSYDADAEKVNVLVDEKRQTIFVEDDGTGISEGGLDDFMRMGDSNKISDPVSPKGRKRIGKFGIAKVLLEFLGSEYELNTCCGGIHISGRERFGERGTEGLEYAVSKVKGKKTGTSILVKGARSVGTKQFSMRSLRNSLTWEVPNQKGFTISLNGERLVRKNNLPTQKFSFKGKLPETGNVEMQVHYFTSQPKISGVFIYVNGRAVGDPKDFDLSKISRYVGNRLFVSVNADKLQEHISFNRAYIKEDNRAYSEVKEWIYQKLGEVRRAVSSTDSRPKKAKSLLPIKARMRQALKEFAPRQTDEKKKPSDQVARSEDGLRDYYLSQKDRVIESNSREKQDDKDRAVDFSRSHAVDLGASQPQARVNPHTQELLINTGHPWYNSSETANLEVLKAHMILGTAFALGWEKYLQNGGKEEQMKRFYDLCSELLRTDGSIREIGESVRDSGIFVPFRRYDIGEVIREHMSLACLNELVEAGVVNIHGNTILGSELNDYMKKALNCIPALDIVRSHELQRVNPSTGKVITRERVRQEYSKINGILVRYKDMLPFIFDVGINKPFFLVQNEAIPRFLGLYSQGALRTGINWGEHMDKYGRLFEKLGGESDGKEEFVGLEMLCDISRSSPYEVFKIVGYAQRKGLNLPFSEKDGCIKYSALHFKRAREQFLIGGENA